VDILLLKILLSFFVAGIWITIATVISERFGSKVGGIMGNMPSNILVSLAFMAWTQTPEFAAEAAKMVPMGMAIDAIFLFVLVASMKKYGDKAFALALFVWLLLAIPLGMSKYDDLIVGSIVFFIVTIGLFYILEKKLDIQSVTKKSGKKYSAKELATRMVFAGGVVAASITIAAFLGPVWGGIFSIFPAVMISTMYLLTKSQGVDFARAAGKVMLLASLNIWVYAIGVYYTYPIYGIVWGTAISYFVTAVFVFLIRPVFERIK